jgi:hypothetical protein
MAVLCLLTNTPWPWPTPAGAASARGGVPTLGTQRSAEWRGRSAAEVCTSEARKIGVPLVARQGRVPQQAWFPCISVKRRDCFLWVPAFRGGRCPPGKARRDVWWKTATPAPAFFSSYASKRGLNCPSCQICWVCPELRCSVIVPVDVMASLHPHSIGTADSKRVGVLTTTCHRYLEYRSAGYGFRPSIRRADSLISMLPSKKTPSPILIRCVITFPIKEL